MIRVCGNAIRCSSLYIRDFGSTLRKRKLTAETVEEARATPAGPLMSDAERTAMEKAEADLWAWCRSAIARQAVTQTHMLQALSAWGAAEKDSVR